MSNISNAYLRSVVFLGASLALAPNIARKEGDKEETKSEVLAKCDSVIRPPQVGDQEIVEPSPPVGRTPVIKPEQNQWRG
ncbi:hypothetical protein [Rhizobium wenxiniae]|uniref:hypothetical protein n=1 Tax=Rhizobium wenxiniae TaxID=1737357 RepID=UPI003C220F01